MFIAGFAETDITPKRGVHLGGDVGRHRPANWVREKIYARAAAIKNNDATVLIISMELNALNKADTDRVREEISDKYGIPVAAVAVHALQIHATPTLGFFGVSMDNPYIPASKPWLHCGDASYNVVIHEKIVSLAGDALASMKPAHMGWTRAIDGRLAFCRRYIMRDGRTRMMPGVQNRDILAMESTADPEVGVVHFTDDDLTNLAYFLNFTSHPVHGYPEFYVTGGWPGAWAREMKAVSGQDCVPLVLNGLCGNVYHSNHLDPGYDENDPRWIGKQLAEDVRNAMRSLKASDGPVGYISETVEIKYRDTDETRLQEAIAYLKENPDPVMLPDQYESVSWDWMYAVSRIDVSEKAKADGGVYKSEVQVFRVGDAAFVFLEGEPFVEGQLKIKLGSAAPITICTHLTNGYSGYLPTPEAIKRGGFEVEVVIASKLAPDALDIVCDKAIELIGKLFE